MVRLDIFSDPVCPWCLIGKANLDRALAAQDGRPFAIEWHPFQLNPDMPPGGMDRAAYLGAKFGGAERVAAMEARVVEAAAAAGIALDFARIPRIPNTAEAHRLIHWAGHEGRQGAMVSALMRAYWLEGRDIGDRDTLVGLAGEAGLDPAMTARLLVGDADRADLAAREAHARARGVNAVPTFVIAGRHVVAGAQPEALWTQVIAELAGLPG
jgi:predicted DsbA family dithiol-disulfide isomerase